MDHGFTPAVEYVGPRSLRFARVMALTFIPADASQGEAKVWLASQAPYLTREDREFISDIHLHDSVVRDWRVNS